MDVANYGWKAQKKEIKGRGQNGQSHPLTHTKWGCCLDGQVSMGIHGMSKIAQLYGKCRKLKQFTCRTCVGCAEAGECEEANAIKGLNLRVTPGSSLVY